MSRRSEAHIAQRQLHLLQCRQGRKQIEALEDEARMAQTKFLQRRRAELGQVLAQCQRMAGIGLLQSRHQRQQRAFAAARRAGDQAQLPA
jgi:hypothetical protein